MDEPVGTFGCSTDIGFLGDGLLPSIGAVAGDAAAGFGGAIGCTTDIGFLDDMMTGSTDLGFPDLSYFMDLF
jgi:hypothetical protein